LFQFELVYNRSDTDLGNTASGSRGGDIDDKSQEAWKDKSQGSRANGENQFRAGPPRVPSGHKQTQPYSETPPTISKMDAMQQGDAVDTATRHGGAGDDPVATDAGPVVVPPATAAPVNQRANVIRLPLRNT